MALNVIVWHTAPHSGDVCIPEYGTGMLWGGLSMESLEQRGWHGEHCPQGSTGIGYTHHSRPRPGSVLAVIYNWLSIITCVFMYCPIIMKNALCSSETSICGLINFEASSNWVYMFISRCYVVAKCNMQHNALLKVIMHWLQSHNALTTKRPSGIRQTIKLNIVSWEITSISK